MFAQQVFWKYLNRLRFFLKLKFPFQLVLNELIHAFFSPKAPLSLVYIGN